MAPEPIPEVLEAPALPEARPARRCGECHESYLTEWTESKHAGSDRSPTYRAMRALAPDATSCDRCHAPLAAVVGRGEAVVAEGVSCEVCHAIAEVTVGNGAAGAPSWSLQLAENRKYGPLCDVADPYFHRAGCSPLHSESRLCAACHHLPHPDPGGTSTGEYAQWQQSEAMRAGLHCQDCHMPERSGTAASGGPERSGISHHGDGPAIGDALRLEATVFASDGGLEVRGTLQVHGAPHALPAGLPGRELAMVAELVDGTGKVLGRDTAGHSLSMLDVMDSTVPFFQATQVVDTRLQPDETRVFTLRLPAAPYGARVVLELVDRPISDALARVLGIEPPLARVLQSLRFMSPWVRDP